MEDLDETANSTQELKQVICLPLNQFLIRTQIDMKREELIPVWVNYPRTFLVLQQFQLNKLLGILVAKLDDIVSFIFDGVDAHLHLSPTLIPPTKLPGQQIRILLHRKVLILGRPKALLVMQDVKVSLTHIV